MNREHFQRIKDSRSLEFPKLAYFVKALHKFGIPISHIDTNDWPNNLKPSVYVHNLFNPFKMKRYCRCSKSDLRLAWKFYNAKGVK